MRLLSASNQRSSTPNTQGNVATTAPDRASITLNRPGCSAAVKSLWLASSKAIAWTFENDLVYFHGWLGFLRCQRCITPTDDWSGRFTNSREPLAFELE